MATPETRVGVDATPVMVVGVDGSKFGYDALEWTLQRFFSPSNFESTPFNFKLVVLHAKPNAASVVGYTEPGGSSVLTFVESNLKKIADFVVAKVKDLCLKYSVNDVMIEVVEGDARSVLCDAVHRHNATMLVLGSHGFGAFKRALLGSVSDYCVHNANCTVMVVRAY